MRKILIIPLSIIITSCSTMKNLYLSEIETDIIKHSNGTTSTITEKDIAYLPQPVQKYFRYCGYIGKEKMINAEIEWKDVFLKRSQEMKWTRLDCYQFNSIAEPTRIVFMKSRIFGITLFEARDKCQNGNGNMLIKLFKLFTIADAKGIEMDESALVTVLSEALLVPGYVFQDYICWTSINSNSVKATLKFNNTEVSGVFHFNDIGEFVRFETNDRYYTEKDGTFKKIKWSVIADNYVERNGIKYPGEVKAVWNMDNGDFEYFKGRITNIEYNVKN